MPTTGTTKIGTTTTARLEKLLLGDEYERNWDVNLKRNIVISPQIFIINPFFPWLCSITGGLLLPHNPPFPSQR